MPGRSGETLAPIPTVAEDETTRPESAVATAGSVTSRRRILRTGLLAGAGILAGPMLNLGRCRLWGQEGPQISVEAADLVLGTQVLDMLGLLTFDWPRLYEWFARPQRFAEEEYREIEATGVNVFHPAVETSARDPYEGAMRWMAGWNRFLRSHGCFLGRVESAGDFGRVPGRGELGLVIGFQNSSHFRTLEDVEMFYGLGQRVSQLTYNETNRLGSGCYAETDRGLSAFGAGVVGEMNRLGMAIDVSHCGERTSLEAIEASEDPVLITHSNCRALVPRQPRCKSDRVIRRMADRGGVMGITVVRAFVGSSRPTVENLLDHFDHVVRLVGVEHVGIGSDVDVTGIDPATGRPNPLYVIRGLDLEARVFQIADGLLRRGYSADAIRAILGGNFQRVLGEIWGRDEEAPASARERRRDPFCPAPRTTWPSIRGALE